MLTASDPSPRTNITKYEPPGTIEKEVRTIKCTVSIGKMMIDVPKEAADEEKNCASSH